MFDKNWSEQIQNFLQVYTNETLTETSSKMVEVMIEKHFMPRYEELLQDTYNYISSIESKKKQLEVLNKYFPLNKKIILDILKMGDKKKE